MPCNCAFLFNDKSRQLTLQSGIFDLSNCIESEAGLRLVQLCDPTKAGFKWIGVIRNVIAIEAISHLETQSVASSESDWFKPEGLPGLEDRVPYFRGGFGLAGKIDLDSWLTSVACAREDHLLASQFTMRKMIIFDRAQVNLRQRLHDLDCLLPLNRKKRSSIGIIAKRDIEALRLLVEPCPVLLGRGCIHDDHIVLRREHVDNKVVNDTAVWARQATILRFARNKGRNVVGSRPLEKFQRIRTCQVKLPHV